MFFVGIRVEFDYLITDMYIGFSIELELTVWVVVV